MNEPKTRSHAVLDARHQAEQDLIGQPRFPTGDFFVKITRCYAVSGDVQLWLPEEDITYFVVECRAMRVKAPVLMHGNWVNRLRFNGHAQLKEFAVEAANLPVDRHDLVTEQVCEEIVSAENPLADVILRLHVGSPKQPSGYMHHRWGRVSEDERTTWSRALR